MVPEFDFHEESDADVHDEEGETEPAADWAVEEEHEAEDFEDETGAEEEPCDVRELDDEVGDDGDLEALGLDESRVVLGEIGLDGLDGEDGDAMDPHAVGGVEFDDAAGDVACADHHDGPPDGAAVGGFVGFGP